MVGVIIDVQGCIGHNNKFTPKEIAIFHGPEHVEHMFIKPPYPFEKLSSSLQRQNNWLYNNYHGLTWNGGSISQATAINMLRCNLSVVNTIYVKGEAKKQWLMELLKHETINIHNVEMDDENFPSISVLKKQFPIVSRCNSHIGSCALQNVNLLHIYLHNRLRTTETVDDYTHQPS